MNATKQRFEVGHGGEHLERQAQEGIDLVRLIELSQIVENPTGSAVVTGIDFTVQPFVAPVIR